MKTRVTHVLPLALMLLLAGLTLWLNYAIEAPPAPEPGRNRHDPDAVVEKFSVTGLDARGAVQYRISAARMVHFPDDDSSELVAPQIAKKDRDSALVVVADRGRVTRDHEEAHFYDNVELVRTGPPGSDELRVRTQYLQVLVKQDIARTDKVVTITHGPSTLSGVGMEYNRQTGRLTLLSNVKGSFDAKRK